MDIPIARRGKLSAAVIVAPISKIVLGNPIVIVLTLAAITVMAILLTTD